MVTILFLLFCSILVLTTTSIIVNTNYGKVQGIQTPYMNKFSNIPFAKPPINELRFLPPQEIEPWDDVYMANANYITACPQTCDSSLCPPVISEDCLVLNVYTPLDSAQNKTNYSVMIWIYGGSFINGWSGGFVYDPTSIIDYIQDIIIVTINYRVGLLGSLYDNQYNTNIKGNQGFLDQKMAIQWTYDNIQYFGGDKDRIVLFGESAGAHSIALHLLYNNDLIRGGIMESPPVGLPLRDPSTWFNVAEELSILIGCSDDYDLGNSSILNCWQSIDFETILNTQNNSKLTQDWHSMLFTPTVLTSILHNQPVIEFQNESIINNIPPFIVGVNHDESFLFLDDESITYEVVYILLIETFGADNAKLILDYYGIYSNTSSIYEIYGKILTDSAFKCSVRNITLNTALNNVWYYNFDVINLNLYKSAYFSNKNCWNRTCHTAELFYIFLPVNASLIVTGFNYDNQTIYISHSLQKYWTNFAKTLDPNSETNPKWNIYGNNELILKITNSSFNNSLYINQDICSFWDNIGYAGYYCTNCNQIITTSTTTQKTSNNNNNNSLSIGVIIVIVIGGIIALIIALICAAKCIFDTKKHINYDKQQELISTDYKLSDY